MKRLEQQPTQGATDPAYGATTDARRYRPRLPWSNNRRKALQTPLTLQPLVAVGLGNGVVRYYFEYANDPSRFARFFSVAFWFQISVVTVLVVIVVSLLGLGAVSSIQGMGPPILLPMLLAVALVPPRDIGNQLLTARQEHGRASFNQFVSFAVATAASLWLVGGLGMGASGRLCVKSSGRGMCVCSAPNIARCRASWSWNSHLKPSNIPSQI